MLNRLMAMESALPHLPNTKPTGASRSPTSGPRSSGAGRRGPATSRSTSRQSPRSSRRSSGSRATAEPVPAARLATASTVENLRELIDITAAVRRAAAGPDRRLPPEGAADPRAGPESEKVTYVVNGLKDIALTEKRPDDRDRRRRQGGPQGRRLRNHHLRGSSAINYEADVILILNEKYHIVAKVNIEFNPYQAQRFRDWIIVSVEKNRSGADNLDIEFQKHFEFSCFDPTGRPVQEKLIEERLYND